ncbi:MAG: outer membrane protein transport protein [Candidatus Delongbacteria bacterium]|nr:outer membrane protein transport protein [Candidatus Delongbacteria bacterium]
MKKILTAAMIIMSAAVFANGLSLNSIGTKAFGMGGAFVALADDATAIHWNPAGLAGQKNSVMLFMTDVVPMTSYKFETYGIDAEGVTNHYISPNFMAVYNVNKFAFGLGAYVPAGLGSEWDGADLTAFGGPAYFDPGHTMANPYAGKEFEWMSKIAVFNFAPAMAYDFNGQFKLGAALNVFYGMFEMKRGEDMVNVMTMQPGQDGMLDTQTEMDIDGIGIGATLSAMIDNDWHSFGFTYKTPVTVDMSGTMNIENSGKYDMDLEVTWPAWVGFGLAFKPFDGKIVLTSDIQITNWNELQALYAKIKLTPEYTQEQEMHLYWHDAVQLRFGLQFDINEQIKARMGYYQDPAPAPERTLNILFPSSTNHALTLGGTYIYQDFNFDLGLEYLWGGERIAAPSGYNMPGTHQMDIFAFSLGAAYNF